MKSYLGIDYGRKRIGLAISEAGLIARPLRTIENKGERKNLITFAEIIKKHNIGIIIMGLPVHKNPAMSNEVRAFAKTLESMNVKIVFQNEMLTSFEAEQNLAKKDRNLIDSVAASMILQDYLQILQEKEKKDGLQN